MDKFDTLFESIIKENKLINKIVTVIGSEDDLGSEFPFKEGDKVKIISFNGYQGNDEEYEVQDIKNKKITAYLTTEFFKV